MWEFDLLTNIDLFFIETQFLNLNTYYLSFMCLGLNKNQINMNCQNYRTMTIRTIQKYTDSAVYTAPPEISTYQPSVLQYCYNHLILSGNRLKVIPSAIIQRTFSSTKKLKHFTSRPETNYCRTTRLKDK